MRRILVVDDDPNLTALMKQKLDPLGFEVVMHHSCRGAYDLARNTQPDLAILDVMLGDGAGYQVSRLIRADATLYLTPVLMMSTLGEDREVQYAMSQGADDYLVKPFSLEQLTRKIEQMDRLRAGIDRADAHEGYVSLDRLMREMDRCILGKRPFRLLYFMVEGFDAFRADRGPQAGEAVVALLKQLIRDDLLTRCKPEPVASHMGGMHFAAMVLGEDFREPCRLLESAFANQVVPLYKTEVKDEMATGGARRNVVVSNQTFLSLQICVAISDGKRYDCARAMLREVQSMQRRAEQGAEEGVFSFHPPKTS